MERAQVEVDKDLRDMVKIALAHLRLGNYAPAEALCERHYHFYDSDAAGAAMDVLQAVVLLEQGRGEGERA